MSHKWLHGQNIPIYYTPCHGANSDALKIALQKLISIATERTRECAVAVAVKKVVGAHSVFEKVVGADATEALRRGRLELNNVRVRLITKRLKRDDFGRGPVLALYMNPSALELYVEEGRITDLIYLPWTEADMNDFASRFPAAHALTFAGTT